MHDAIARPRILRRRILFHEKVLLHFHVKNRVETQPETELGNETRRENASENVCQRRDRTGRKGQVERDFNAACQPVLFGVRDEWRTVFVIVQFGRKPQWVRLVNRLPQLRHLTQIWEK